MNDFKKYTLRDMLGLTVALAILISSGLYSFGKWVEYSLRTEVVEATVKHRITTRTSNIDIWTAVRKVDERYVEDCADDIYKHYECDVYEEVCVARDSTGACIQYVTGDCIDGHYEYDYNIKGWRHYKTIKKEFWDSDIHYIDLKSYSRPEYNVTTKLIREILVTKDGYTRRLKVNNFPTSNIVSIKRRVKSKKILAYVK